MLQTLKGCFYYSALCIESQRHNNQWIDQTLSIGSMTNMSTASQSILAVYPDFLHMSQHEVLSTATRLGWIIILMIGRCWQHAWREYLSITISVSIYEHVSGPCRSLSTECKSKSLSLSYWICMWWSLIDWEEITYWDISGAKVSKGILKW